MIANLADALVVIAELEAELEQCLNCCKRVGELEAHNQQLLADKEASPAIIAGYRERGEQLLARVAELESKIAEMDAVFDAVLETHRSDTARMSKRIIELEQAYEKLKKQFKSYFLAQKEIEK